MVRFSVAHTLQVFGHCLYDVAPQIDRTMHAFICSGAVLADWQLHAEVCSAGLTILPQTHRVH